MHHLRKYVVRLQKLFGFRPYGGIIESWEPEYLHSYVRIHGYLLRDEACRSYDDTFICTSILDPGQNIEEGSMIKTMNTRYRLGKPVPF